MIPNSIENNFLLSKIEKFEKISNNLYHTQSEIDNQLGYSFVDENPISGNNYYRIIYVDLDNHQTISNGIKIFNDEEISISLSPNPTKNSFTLECFTYQEEDLIVDLYDIIGRKISQNHVKLKHGANEIVIDVSCIPNGFYNVHCYSNNKLYKTKLLKI